MKAQKTQRDSQGRFLIGHPGGPGRPRRATEAGYLEVLMEACPLERWRGVVERAIVDAEGGDPQARQWLAAYLIGRPDAKAPSPLTVVIQGMIGTDPALERAAAILAKPHLDAEMWPVLEGDVSRQRAIEAEAAAAILANMAEDSPG